MVTSINIPGADALEPGNLLRPFQVRGPLDVPLIGACGAQNALKFHAGDHVGKFGIAVSIQPARIKRSITKGQDHCSCFQLRPSWFIIILDCFGQTDLFTQPAADAQVPINGIGQGYGLSVLDVNGSPEIKTAVEFIPDGYRAGLGAHPAAGTFSSINVPGNTL